MSTTIDPETYVLPAPITNNRKRRTKEEIDAANLEKEQKKQQREKKRLINEQYSTQLIPSNNIFSIAAMTIIRLCANNMQRTNLAFKQMIASRIIFPPKKNINKFATGGIAEECISQLFCDLGLDCDNLSETSNVIDLEINVPTKNEEMVNLKVSLKNSGKIASPPILENYRGQKRTEIRPLPSTFIIYTEMDIKRVRMIYLDEDILRQGYPTLTDEEFHAEIYSNNDSNLTFKSGFLAKFIPRLPVEYILNADYPEDITGLCESNFCKLALSEVIKQLNPAK